MLYTHVVEPAFGTWAKKETGEVRHLSAFPFDKRMGGGTEMLPYTRRADISWTNKCNPPEQKGTPPFPLVGGQVC